MGKFMDFLLSDTWEEYQRIQLFKKVGSKIEQTPKKKFKNFLSKLNK